MKRFFLKSFKREKIASSISFLIFFISALTQKFHTQELRKLGIATCHFQPSALIERKTHDEHNKVNLKLMLLRLLDISFNSALNLFKSNSILYSFRLLIHVCPLGFVVGFQFETSSSSINMMTTKFRHKNFLFYLHSISHF